MNGIQVYQNNTLTLAVLITNDTDIILSGYTALMAIDFLTGITTITGTTILNGETSFTISNTINNVEPYVYEYEIYIVNINNRYTILQDSYSVLSIIN